MFENLEPLDAENHKDLRFSPASDYRFVDGVRAVDRDKMKALDDATLAGWVRGG